MEEKLRAAFGDEFINMVNNWPQLTPDDVKELYERSIDEIHAVYNSWKELVMYRLKGGACEEYIIPFVDTDALAKHIAETEKSNWLELPSGKLICCG